MKPYIIKVNIDEIIEFSKEYEKLSLFKSLFGDMSNKTTTKAVKWLLSDMLEAEMEFKKRDELIKAYKLLIKAIKF